jgi:flagellar hook-length control protein FliK
VLSVTSEIASLSVPNAPARAARPDQTPALDDFSALVDGAVADPRSDDRAPVTAPDRPSPQQRPDDTSAASDRRDAPSAPQPAEAVADQDAATGQPPKPEAVKPANGTIVLKTASKNAVSEVAGTTDLLSSAASVAAQPATAVVPVAVAIAAPVVPVAVSTPASSDSARQPLAIAAAAIATTASTIEASKPAATPPPAPIDPAAKPAAMPATAQPAAADPQTAMLDVPETATNETAVAPVNPSQPKSDILVQADPAVAAPAIAAAPVAAVAEAPVAATSPRTAAKAPASPSTDGTGQTVPAGAADDGDFSQATPMTDKGKNAALQGPAPEGDGKPAGVAMQSPKGDATRPEVTKPDATKPDPAQPDAPAAAATAHEHRAPTAVQLQADAADAGQITNPLQQPAQAPVTSAATQQLTVTASNTAPVPLNGLALHIAVTAQGGRSRFEIRLDPAELGRIDVRIDLDRHGQIVSHLTVEKPETLAMLRQDAPQLQRALDNAGFKTGDNGLQFSLRDQSSSGQHGGNEPGGPAHRLIMGEDDLVPVTIAGRTYGRTPGSGGGVDIRV